MLAISLLNLLNFIYWTGAIGHKENCLKGTFEESHTAQKMKFSFKDFFSTCDQDQVDLLKKSVVENFNFCTVPHEIRSIKYCPGMSCLLNCPIKDIHLKTFKKISAKNSKKHFYILILIP